MSGRPKNPDWTIEPWAPDTNYGVGALPWEGNPTKTAWAGASSVGFTPKLGVPAQAMNYVLNAFATDDQNAKDAIDALTDFTGQLPLAFAEKMQPLSVTTKGAFYAPAARRWYVCGATGIVYSSIDRGLSWSQQSGVQSAASDENTTGGDEDASGNVVIAGDTRYVFELTYSTSTWTKKDVVGTNISTPCFVVYDPINALWCFSFNDSGAQHYTSANRSSWTARTSTLTDPTSTLVRTAVDKVNGRIVCTCVAGTDIEVETSDDGGVTWTNEGTWATAVTSPTVSSLTYNEETETYMLVVGEVSGTPTSEVWISTDGGENWTKTKSLTNSCLRNVAAHGAMWVAIGSTVADNDVVYSTDDGATWHRTGQWHEGTPVGVFGGGGQLLALTASYLYRGLYLGTPNLGQLA